MRVRLSKNVVDKAKPGPTNLFLWDTALPRFGLKVTPAGAKTYVVQYRQGGRVRRYTIGRHGQPWTVETARKDAQAQLGRVAKGEDPQTVKTGTRDAPTVADLADRFLREHADAKKKPSTAAEYRRIVQTIIGPKLGRVRVADLTSADVARLHHSLRASPYTANRAAAVLGVMCSCALRWRWRTDGVNPVRGLERFREQKRERFLAPTELERLGKVLTAAERGKLARKSEESGEHEPVTVSPFALAAIRLLALTGARRGEVLGLRWEHVDLEQGVVRLPDSKTGAKSIYLPGTARAVLASLPRVEGTPYVFPGGREGAALVNLKKPWGAIREAAGLPDVRLHDLRHSFAAAGAGAGLGLPIIGRALGHKTPTTTARYAHVAPDPVREAVEAVGGRIAAGLAGRL